MSSVKAMTNAEKAAVEELRKKFVNDLSPKLYENTLIFYRFLKARDFNLDNAEDMLRKHIQWRKEQDIENIFTYKLPEVLEKYVPESRFGFDKDGCPARYIPLGRADGKGIQLSAKFNDINKIAVRELESDLEILEDHYNRFGKILGGCTYVYDMRELTFAKATDKSVLGHFAYFVTIYQDNYPEMMKAVYIINPPMFFSIPFAIIKACLTGTLLSKITILSKDDWKEELLKRFDADQLPAFLGGTMTDPDGNPMCYTIVNHGEVVPESYYIHKSKKSLAQAEGVKKITLSRGSYSEVTVEVKKCGSLIEWEYETNSRDIKFGLLFQETGINGKNVIELVPTQKIDTNDYPQTGMYKCGKVGTYVILFDNSYSWMRSKRIYYRVKVVPPEDQEISIVD